MSPVKRLTQSDYQQAAAKLRTGVAEIKAVRDVESRGRGFLPDGRLIIRFEGHRFRKETGGKYDQEYPTLSHEYMPDCPYNKGVVSDYARLKIAMSLDPTAALLSCSWGMFQIMGNEYWRCGFKSVHDFVDYLKTGELAHLMVFCQFNISKKLDGYLRNRQWEQYAEGYNGKNYKANDYDGQLDRRFKWHTANP